MRRLAAPAELYPPPLNAQAVEIHYYQGPPHLRYHYHPEFELVLVRGSGGRRMIGRTLSAYQDGDLVLLGAFLPHTWIYETPLGGELENTVVHFTRESLGLDLLAKPELRAIRRLLDRSIHGLRWDPGADSPVWNCLTKLRELRGLEALLSTLHLLDLLAHCRQVESLSPPGQATAREMDHHLFGRVIEFLHQQSHLPVSLAQAAEVVNMSVPTFCRFFRRTCGQSFVDYLNDWRISRATYLLRQSDEPITRIAGRVGYENLSYFNRQFMRRRGITPRQCRAENQE